MDRRRRNFNGVFHEDGIWRPSAEARSRTDRWNITSGRTRRRSSAKRRCGTSPTGRAKACGIGSAIGMAMTRFAGRGARSGRQVAHARAGHGRCLTRTKHAHARQSRPARCGGISSPRRCFEREETRPARPVRKISATRASFGTRKQEGNRRGASRVMISGDVEFAEKLAVPPPELPEGKCTGEGVRRWKADWKTAQGE